VFAHPDDEAFGTGGMLVTCVERGVEVQLLYATPGDAGQIADPSLASPETLGAVRRQELAEACAILGTQPPEVLDYRDGRLAEADADEVEREIVARIRALRPDVVLTFDANGGYGHPDHIAIHHRTLAAVEAAAHPARFPELGLPPHRPAKLYLTAYSRSLLARMQADMRRHDTGLDFSDVQTISDAEVGTEDARVTTVVDVRRVFDRRWAAHRAHRTQYGPSSPFFMVPESVLREWMAFDTFVRAHPRFDGRTEFETDVLEGIL
jgi:LmbE family N-acetylglucosaminyl deacetylase